MYLYIIKNPKKKLWLLAFILFLWIGSFLITQFLFHSHMSFTLTINNEIRFSYPAQFQLESVYVHDQCQTAVIQSNATINHPMTEKFSTYRSLQGRFSFDYPSAFELNEQDFSGSEILYHVDFHDMQNIKRGFSEVWNLTYSLKEFLDQSKTTSQLNYKYFNSSPVVIDGSPGFLWDYSVSDDDGKYYKASEVFFKKNSHMYRLSYFVPESQWNKEQAQIFEHMAGSFKGN